MNISFSFFSRFALSSFSENFFSSLTQGQKRIIAIASLTFGCLSIGYFTYRYYFKAKQKNVTENPPSPLILTPIEKKLVALTPHQIEALAKKIVAIVMSRLKIDVTYKALAGETYPDTSGKRHQVYWDQYDPSSKLMIALLPRIVQKINEAFTHPTQFVNHGLTFKLIDSRDNSGLVNQIHHPALQTQIATKVDEIIKNFYLNTAVFEVTLRLDQTTGVNAPLTFDMHSWLNGAQFGHTGGDISSIEKSASQCAV